MSNTATSQYVPTEPPLSDAEAWVIDTMDAIITARRAAGKIKTMDQLFNEAGQVGNQLEAYVRRNGVPRDPNFDVNSIVA